MMATMSYGVDNDDAVDVGVVADAEADVVV